MAQRAAPDGWDSPGNLPSVVQVTVVPGPRRHVGVRRAHVLIVLAVLGVIAAVAVTLVVLTASGRHAPPARAVPAPRMPTMLVETGPPVGATAEAYRFPLGCLGSTLAGAARGHRGPCWQYGVYVTAILRRVGGEWRLALEATSPSCPRIALPALVRQEVVVCRR